MVSFQEHAMDCEEFELELISDLYGELPESQAERLRAHEDSCDACKAAAARLRRGKGVGLPLLPPPVDMEERILAAAGPHMPEGSFAVDTEGPGSVPAASAAFPHSAAAPQRGGRVLRALTWAGSYAMRPQLAMAAVFVLVVGSSLLLLRGGPGTGAGGPVRVTERGAPEAQQRPVDQPAATAAPLRLPAPAEAPRQQAAPPPAAQAESLLQEKEGKSDAKDANEAAGDGLDADKQLAAARAKRATDGCKAAIGQLEQVANSNPGSVAGKAAASEAADCFRKEGQKQTAAAEPPAAGVAASAAAAAPAKKAAAKPSGAPPVDAAKAQQQKQGGSGAGKLAAPPKAPHPDAAF